MGKRNIPAALASLLVTFVRFVANDAGRVSGVSRFQKLRLAFRILNNYFRVRSLSTPAQHFLLAEEILRIPKTLKGEVVECGCYNGSSTISLSLACALTDRRLVVCDSFEGLPEPENEERSEIHAESKDYYVWERGEFSSEGGLAGVKKSVEKYGDVDVCDFVKGFFEHTLPHLGTDSIVLVFEDADLVSSVEDCLRYLWPKLQEGCKFYCHEPWSIKIVSLFYDERWWNENLHSTPPGFYGSGWGIVMDGRYTTVGYARKFSVDAVKERGEKIVHAGSRGFWDS